MLGPALGDRGAQRVRRPRPPRSRPREPRAGPEQPRLAAGEPGAEGKLTSLCFRGTRASFTDGTKHFLEAFAVKSRFQNLMAITKDHWSPCPAMPWASPGARRTVVCSTPRKPRASIPALENISPDASPPGPVSPDSRCTCTLQDHTHLWLCSDPADFPHAWVSAEPLTASTHRLGEMARYHCTCENVSPLCDCGGKRLLMDRRAQVEVTESLVPSVRAECPSKGLGHAAAGREAATPGTHEGRPVGSV